MNPSNLKKLTLAVVVALLSVAAASLPALAAQKKKGGPEPLRIESVKVATKAGPLSLRVRATVHSHLELWVNGERVRHPFQQQGKRSQKIDLRAGDGLHAGANRLRLRATRHGEAFAARRTVNVPERALLVDAGEDVGATVRVHAQLGAAPRVGGAMPAVDYRWRIVGRSEGAKAVLRNRNQAQPLLQPKSSGTFELQVEADPDGPQQPVFDSVTVAASPDDPPLGAPINTLDSGGIKIAGDTYGTSGKDLSYVVLERTTRNVVEKGSAGRDAAGLKTLNDLASKYGGGGNYMKYLMIVSGRQGIPEAQGDDAARLFKALGSPRLREESFLALRVGLPFSIVGIPGAPMESATVRIPGGYPDPVSGAIVGYLQKNQGISADGTPLYDFASTERPAFDTRAPGSTDTTNIVKVGDASYSGSLTEGGTAGFHVVVLVSLTLRLLHNLVVKTNGGGNDRAIQAEAAKTIKGLIERPGGPTVIVQTVGKPKAVGPEWASVVKELVRLGANPQYVNALYGNDGYALVSRLESEQPPAESSTAFDLYPASGNSPARLVGALARTRNSTFEPSVFSTPSEKSPEGGVNLGLIKVADQPQQGWPQLAPGAPAGEAAAAQKYVCEALNFCQKADSCAELRDCYWKKYGSDWDLKHSILVGLGFQKGKGFSEATFAAVKQQLLTEVAAVANVQSYLRRLQEPFDQSATRAYVDLQSISQKIWDALQKPQADNSTAWALGLVGKAVAIGQLAGPPASAGAAGLSAIFALASYLSTQEGPPIFGSEVKAKAGQLANALLDRIETARRQTVGLGMVIVSDYGKLTSADRHVDSDWTLPSDPGTTAATLRIASQQWFYESLVPVAYPYLIRANANNARLLKCEMAGREGWPNQPDSDQMLATIGYDNNGNPIKSIFFFTRGIGGGSSPLSSLGDDMFLPRGAQKPGAGIEKLGFFTARVFNGRVIPALDHRFECNVGWLPGMY
jgi:hypothetical protein